MLAIILIQVCKMLKGGQMHRIYNEEHRVPYAWGWHQSEDVWVGYEEIGSLETKVGH